MIAAVRFSWNPGTFSSLSVSSACRKLLPASVRAWASPEGLASEFSHLQGKEWWDHFFCAFFVSHGSAFSPLWKLVQKRGTQWWTKMYHSTFYSYSSRISYIKNVVVFLTQKINKQEFRARRLKKKNILKEIYEKWAFL